MVLVGLSLLCLAGAEAASFPSHRVPAEARWILYADVARLVETEFGRQLLWELDQTDGGSRLKTLRDVAGLDIQKDLKTAMFYGTNSVPEQGATLLEGSFDAARIAAILKKNATYLDFSHREHVIHSWAQNLESGEASAAAATATRLFVVFPGPSLLVVSQSLPMTKHVLDVLDKKKPALQASPLLDDLQSASASSFLSGSAFVPATRETARYALLRQTRRAFLELGESQAVAEGRVVFFTDTPHTAASIYLVIQGMVAAAVLQQDQKPELAGFAKSLRASVDGNKAIVVFRHPSSACVEVLKNWRAYLQGLPAMPSKPAPSR